MLDLDKHSGKIKLQGKLLPRKGVLRTGKPKLGFQRSSGYVDLDEASRNTDTGSLTTREPQHSTEKG
jgi:hypothetical protein